MHEVKINVEFENQERIYTTILEQYMNIASQIEKINSFENVYPQKVYFIGNSNKFVFSYTAQADISNGMQSLIDCLKVNGIKAFVYTGDIILAA